MPAVQFCIRGLFIRSFPSPAALGRPQCLRPFLPRRITHNIRSSYGLTRQAVWSRPKNRGTQVFILHLPVFIPLHAFHFLLPQKSPLGQSAQPQPHVDFPCFFFLTILTITAMTAASSMVQIIIVAMFSYNQANIFHSSCPALTLFLCI